MQVHSATLAAPALGAPRPHLALIGLLCAGLLALGACPPAAGDELTRVSTSLPAEHAGLVLRRVARVFAGGFARADADRVAAAIDKLPAEREGLWEFTAQFEHRAVPLRVRALVDDIGMVDLEFSTEPLAAQSIRRAIDSLSSERGL